MEHDEKQEFTSSPLPLLPRLDRLDRLLQLLEEKHSLSGRHSSSSVVRKMEPEDQCKSLSSALEEVHHKGTLMERLAILENQVLQLSLEMDEGNTSSSSCSTINAAPEKVERGSDLLTTITRTDKDGDVMMSPQESTHLNIGVSPKEEAFAEACSRNSQDCRNSRKGKRTVSILRYRKWLGCFRAGC